MLATKVLVVALCMTAAAAARSGFAQSVVAGTGGSPPTAQDSFVGLVAGREYALSFEIAAGGPYSIAQLEVVAYHYEGVPGDSATFTIYADNSGAPGNALTSFVASSLPSLPAADPPSTAPVTQLAPASAATLAAGTYWLGASTTEQQVNWIDGLNAFGTTASRDVGGPWNVQGGGGNLPAFALLGGAVPEPSTLVLGGMSLVALAGARRKSRWSRRATH